MTLLGLVALMTLMDLVVALPATLLTSFPLLPSLPFLSRVTLSRVTTLFISVSQSLPPTAYVKMIDVWLIFAQMIPFVEVLLHSWMDLHRVAEDRQIDHHGTERSIIMAQ